jgi:hypothetical protein
MHVQPRKQQHGGPCSSASRAVWHRLRDLLDAHAGLTAACFVALLAGCATTQQRTEVAGAAALDLACEAVEVSELSDGSYAASGCGRGAVYTQLCDYNGCRWGRLRHGHEQQVAASMMPPPTAGREILAAPPPEQRMVLPAPAPDGNVAPPAPPPPPGASPAPDPNMA